MCPQVEQRFRLHVSASDPILESEDCLYLNVFVPVDVSKRIGVGVHIAADRSFETVDLVSSNSIIDQ